MKKFYSLALAALVALSAAAAPVAFKKVEGKMPHKVNTIPGVKAHKNVADISKTIVPIANGRQVLDADYEDPEDPIEAPEIIVDPEGTPQAMKTRSLGFVSSWFGIQYYASEYPGQVVYGDNNEVYIRDIIPTAASGVYVKGTIEDGKVVVKLPQICYLEYDEEYDELFVLYANVCEQYDFEKDGEEYIGYRNVEDQSLNELVYNIGEDGSLSLTLNGEDFIESEAPQYIIGLVDDVTPAEDAWFGEGAAYQLMTKFDEVANELPEGIELEDWVLLADRTGMVKVGFDGNDVYLTNLFEFFPEGVVKGSIEGDKVVLPCGQYLGTAYGYFVYFSGAEWADLDWSSFEELEVYELNYDADAKVLSTDNELIDFAFSASTSEYDPLDYYENPTFRYQSEEDTNAAPEDPYVVYFEHNAERSWGTNEGYIEWVIPSTNVNGFLLPTDRMFYNFYVDGKVKTFSTDEYMEFDQDYVDVPWDFEDGWDLQALDDARYFTFFEEEYESFGLQSFYVNEEGTRFASNLVTYTPEPEDGVEGVAVDNKVLRSVEYFNLNGQRIANPGNGLYIVRQNYTDGTAKVAKVVVK